MKALQYCAECGIEGAEHRSFWFCRLLCAACFKAEVNRNRAENEVRLLQRMVREERL